MRRPRTSTLLGALAGTLGLGFFARLLWRSDVVSRLDELCVHLLWMVPVVALPIVLGTLSWARAFPRVEGAKRPALRDLFTIRLAGEAINNALVSAYVAGEPVKGLLAARFGATPAAGLASAVIGKTTFVLGEVLLLLVGLALAVDLFGSHAPLVTALLSVSAGGLALVALAVLVQQRKVVGRGARILQAMRLGSRRLWRRALPAADAIDASVRRYYKEQRGDFLASVAWAAGGWLVGAIELWIWLSFVCPTEDALALAVVLEAGVAVAKGLSFFVPGSIGVQEGGIAWLFGVTGLGAEAGAAYAVLRRFRELVWIWLGFLALWWHVRPTGAPSAAEGA